MGEWHLRLRYIQVLENFPTASHKSRYLVRKENCQLSIGRKESATCWWNDIEWTSACVLVCSGQMSQSGNICRLLFFFEVTLNEPLRVFWSLAQMPEGDLSIHMSNAQVPRRPVVRSIEHWKYLKFAHCLFVWLIREQVPALFSFSKGYRGPN